MKPICPCKDCENQGCGAYHEQCQPYLEWKRIVDAGNEARAKEQDKWNDPKRPQRYKRRLRAK